MSFTLSPDIPDNLIESYLSESEIAIDTELHGLRLFRDEVCLVQICDNKKNVSLVKPVENNIFLFDLLTSSFIKKSSLICLLNTL